MSTRRRLRVEQSSERASVSQIELFFDLVFVFALTRVTDLLSEDTTAVGLLRAVLVLSVLWWIWVGYSWMGNLARADEGLMRAVMFAAMGAAFIIALSIPEAFDDLPGGLSGPVVFAICYFAVRAIHWLMFWNLSREDQQLRSQLVRWLPSLFFGTTLLLVASQTDGTARILLWVGALAGDYVGTLFAGADWRLRSPSHFAERHGLIIIVALGESIVSIGIGVTDLPISWPIVVASLLGLAVSALMWWSYFDVAALQVEHELSEADGTRQIKIARNSYSFGHLPMVIGIVLVALGLKKVLSYVGDDTDHSLNDPLSGVPLWCLLGGAALYLVALAFFKFYATHEVSGVRLVIAAALLALFPLGAALPALACLGLLTAVLAALIGWETRHYYQTRERIRHADEH